MRDQDCQTWMLNQTCPYAYIFETPNIGDLNLQHQADNLPHLFVIEPLETKQTEFQSGDELDSEWKKLNKCISSRIVPRFLRRKPKKRIRKSKIEMVGYFDLRFTNDDFRMKKPTSSEIIPDVQSKS